MTAEGPGPAPLVETRCQGPGPLRIGSESQVGRTSPLDGLHPRGAPLICARRETCTEPLVRRVDRSLTTRLWILDHKETDIREAELTWIDDLDGDDLAPAPEPDERRTPRLGWGDEVRHHDGKAASSKDAVERIDRASQVDLAPER